MGQTDSQAGAEKSATEVAERRAAYMRILHAQEGALLRAARRMCGGPHEDRAQDLTQETLVRGYEAFLAGRFQEGTNARAWLLRILTNLIINDYRHEQRWKASIDIEALLAQGDASFEALRARAEEQPETALLAKALSEPLERALASLSEELRLCVLLVDIEGMEYAETATILGIPVGTVRSRLSRARSTLHTLLYDYAQERRRI